MSGVKKTKDELYVEVGTSIRTPTGNVSGKVEKDSHSTLEDNIVASLAHEDDVTALKAGVQYVVPFESGVVNPGDTSYVFDPAASADDRCLYDDDIWTYNGAAWTNPVAYLDTRTGIDDKMDQIPDSGVENNVVTFDLYGNSKNSLVSINAVVQYDSDPATNEGKLVKIDSSGNHVASSVTVADLGAARGLVDGEAITVTATQYLNIAGPTTTPELYQFVQITGNTTVDHATNQYSQWNAGKAVTFYIEDTLTLKHNTSGTYAMPFILTSGEDTTYSPGAIVEFYIREDGGILYLIEGSSQKGLKLDIEQVTYQTPPLTATDIAGNTLDITLPHTIKAGFHVHTKINNVPLNKDKGFSYVEETNTVTVNFANFYDFGEGSERYSPELGWIIEVKYTREVIIEQPTSSNVTITSVVGTNSTATNDIYFTINLANSGNGETVTLDLELEDSGGNPVTLADPSVTTEVSSGTDTYTTIQYGGLDADTYTLTATLPVNSDTDSGTAVVAAYSPSWSYDNLQLSWQDTANGVVQAVQPITNIGTASGIFELQIAISDTGDGGSYTDTATQSYSIAPGETYNFTQIFTVGDSTKIQTVATTDITGGGSTSIDSDTLAAVISTQTIQDVATTAGVRRMNCTFNFGTNVRYDDGIGKGERIDSYGEFINTILSSQGYASDPPPLGAYMRAIDFMRMPIPTGLSGVSSVTMTLNMGVNSSGVTNPEDYMSIKRMTSSTPEDATIEDLESEIDAPGTEFVDSVSLSGSVMVITFTSGSYAYFNGNVNGYIDVMLLNSFQCTSIDQYTILQSYNYGNITLTITHT